MPIFCSLLGVGHGRLRDAGLPRILQMLPNHKTCNGKSSSLAVKLLNLADPQIMFSSSTEGLKTAREIASVNKSER